VPNIEQVSHMTAVCLFTIYILSLVFQLKTHRSLIAQRGPPDQIIVRHSQQHADARAEEELMRSRPSNPNDRRREVNAQQVDAQQQPEEGEEEV
jgi:Ca2+/H+ antiporter